MDLKLEKALALFNDGKQKKALSILRKLNSKVANRSYTSLELEGLIYFNSKNYKLAEIKFTEALTLASIPAQQVNALNNLKSVVYHLNDITKTIGYLKQLLAIDGSIETINYRKELCEFAVKEAAYDTLLQYVDKLMSVSEHACRATVMKTIALASSKQEDLLGACISRIRSEFNLYKSYEIETVCLELERNGFGELLSEIVSLAGEKFAHESWYKTITGKDEIQSNRKITNGLSNNVPKERVVSDNSQALQITESLLKQLESAGAYFHPRLRFNIERNNLSIKCFHECRERVLMVPLQCMPLMRDFLFDIHEGKLTYTVVEQPINSRAVPILKSLVDLYNACDKVRIWQRTFPLLVLQNHKSFVDAIFEKALKLTKLNSYKALFDEDKYKALTIASFFGSREFQYNQKHLNVAGVQSSEPIELGLLSVIDFLNHKIGCSGYGINADKGQMEINTLADKENNEVFVEYNLLDPVYTYFIYGFVDSEPQMLYSIVDEISLTDGTKLSVKGGSGRPDISVYEAFPHIADYLPAQLHISGNNIVVNGIAIPSYKKRGVLKQSISYILNQTIYKGLNISESALEQEILHVERQIVYNNLHFWQKIRTEFLPDVEGDTSISNQVKEDVATLLQICISHLEQYIKSEKVNLIS